jgi:cytochrome c
MKNLVKNLVKKNKKCAMDGVTYLAFAFCVAGLATIVADLFYQPKIAKKRGYEIEIALDGKPVAKKEEKIIDLAELMKTADVERGAKIFKKCASCHNVGKGEGAKVGPGLYGVVGRAKGVFAGFSYSDAMKAKGGIWDRVSINQFITKPKDYLPGTKMAFAGLKKPQDRADVILYLEKQAK